MGTIDIKLKSYEELQYEVLRLSTDLFLKNQEIERLKVSLEEERKKEVETLERENIELKTRVVKALEYIYTYYGKPVVKSYGGTLKEIKEILEEGEIKNDD